ncbi:PKD domain-containing protein [Flavobacterium sp. 270]|uniref:PKD domain-containing protein n=1 Tax=Flavobacterium sp. 270 TaxID=2512114 RepID=UPI001064BB17|nr:PKD domain-containing protein [Flavobacterium sp. 270]TDW46047.1 PKD domain-containing protein [Flavobacterium sp. 270]
MKKFSTILVMVTVIFISICCSKDEAKNEIDCVGEAILISLKHSVDAGNSKKINYSIEYGGTNTITAVKWTFGDGTSETVNGLTTSHTYSTTGTFETKADVMINKSGSSCTVSPKKSITVN